MGLIRRLSVSAGVAVSILATLAIASVGAAGGFGSGPGHFVFHDLSASASFFNPVDGSTLDLSVDRSLFINRPRGGGGSQTQPTTVMSINIFVANPDPTQPPVVVAFGCFVIPDSDFVVSTDLQTATLNAIVDETNFCPSALVPLDGPEPAKGDGGGGGGFTFPVTVSATWTGTGAVGTQNQQGTFRCLSFVSAEQIRTQSAISSNVTAHVSDASGLSEVFSGGAPEIFAIVLNQTFTEEVAGTGILSPACGFGGKG